VPLKVADSQTMSDVPAGTNPWYHPTLSCPLRAIEEVKSQAWAIQLYFQWVLFEKIQRLIL